MPRPAQAPWLLVGGPWPWPGRSPSLGTRFGGRGSPARSNGHVLRTAARSDSLEDVVQRVFLDFEVQRALGDVEGARHLGEIAVVRQDRRQDGVALKRVEVRHGEGAR